MKIMSEPTQKEFQDAQKRRAVATALGLIGFVAVIFLITIVKLQGHALNKPF
jgi:preprotein translocase subunit Sss1